MMIQIYPRNRPWLSGAAVGLAVIAGPAFAQNGGEANGNSLETSNKTYLDLGAGLGYGTNPSLRTGSDRASLFGRISASLVHNRMTERASTALSVYAENNTYFQRKGSKQLLSLRGSHRYRASETVTVFGDLGISADFGGQLVGRIFGEPGIVSTVPESDLILPPITDLDPGVVFTDTRQYRFNAQVGASFAMSERDSFNIAAGADFAFFDADGGDRNYRSFSQSIGYSRQLDERSSLGAQVAFREIDYPGNVGSLIINPALVYRNSFAEGWTATISGGVQVERQNSSSGKRNDYSPSFSAAVCQLRELSRLCMRASHTIQAGGGQTSLNATSFGADYSRQVSEVTTFRLSATYSRYDNAFSGTAGGMSHFYTAAGSVSHRVADRLFVEGQLGVRKLDPPGVSIKTDLQASVSVKYRIGNL